MKLSFWPYGHKPSAREVLLALCKVAAFGAVLGAAGRLIGAVFGIRIEFFPGPNLPQAWWAGIAAGAMISVSFYACCALPWVYAGPLVARLPRSFKTPITALIGAVGSCAGLTIAVALTDLLPGARNPWSGHLGRILAAEAALGAIIALIVGAFRKLQVAVIQAEAKAHEKEMRESQLAEAAARAQAAALQSQINPHFFFNTLNTLAALIPAEAVDAQQVVSRLGEMFRYTLACSRGGAVTLDQELEFTENYLRLEQARFRERLRVTLPRGSFQDIALPGLSLQPLVENAIKYGVAKRLQGGEVEVAVKRNGTSYRIDVLSPEPDTFEKSAGAKDFFRAGHALENVRDRLKLFAGEKAGVDIEREEASRVRVSLVLPK